MLRVRLMFLAAVSLLACDHGVAVGDRGAGGNGAEEASGGSGGNPGAGPRPGFCRRDDLDADGNTLMTELRTYDGDRLKLTEWIRQDEIFQRRTTRYEGTATKIEELDLKPPGSVDIIERTTYDEMGRVHIFVREQEPYGSFTATTTYGPYGPERVDIDWASDGTIDGRQLYSYESGHLVRYELYDQPVEPPYVEHYKNDDSGFLRELTFDDLADGVLDGRITYEYDEDGRLHFVRSFAPPEPWTLTSTNETLYDAAGRKSEEWTEKADGTYRQVLRSHYDDRGDLLSTEMDRGADGVIDERTVYDYACWVP